MADQRLSKTGLQYFWNRIKTVFATKTEVNTLSDRVDDIVAEGGEPNVIETVKVNGTALTPDASKAVDVEAATINSNGSQKVIGITQDSVGLVFMQGTVEGTETVVKTYAGNQGNSIITLVTKAYVDANGGKIDKIMVNGVEQTISTKTVYLIVPTKTSDLTNDSNYLTEDEVDAKVNSALTSVYKLEDPVPTFADLPMTGNKKGDVRDVLETGINYEWTGTAWEPLGPMIDTSAFWSKTELTAITTAEIDAIIDGTGS